MPKHPTRTFAVLATAACLLAPGAAQALPGDYSLEAYTPSGKREFARGESYFNRVYTRSRHRWLDRPTRRIYRFRRQACRIKLQLSRRNLRMLHAQWRAGNAVYLKRYRGRIGGRRVFVTICRLRPGSLRGA